MVILEFNIQYVLTLFSVTGFTNTINMALFTLWCYRDAELMLIMSVLICVCKT